MNVPHDYLDPDWSAANWRMPHEWKNYISERLREMWQTFTPDQRSAIAESADLAADRENWD